MALVDALADTRAQLTAAWDVRGIDLATIVGDDGTAQATRRRFVSGSIDRAALPLLDTASSLKMGRTLGQGGMGLVRAAEQIALAREVAVKSLRPDADPRQAAQLLREGMIAGALEHPNIVPVHALGRDRDGHPIIVMKRVDGTGWDALLAAEAGQRGEEAFLRKHLGILLQVTRAVHFAHDKGIVHRDVKPANVMLGAHDEVYLVDWGIAVSLREDGVKGVPLAVDVASIEGTPAYMSPEMAAANGALIDARTDIYLLGATLHEVLTGAPPHEGEDLVAVLTSAFASAERSLPEWVPRELLAICVRAMQRLSDNRHQSAHDLARAIEEVLEHRGSVILTAEAVARLSELQRAADATAEVDEQGMQSLYMTYSECRFAFAHALRAWEDNDTARRGLDRAVLMVKVELGRDAPEAASLLLRDLPADDDRLARVVGRALKRKRKQGARLEEIAHDVDLRVAARQRAWLAAVLGGVWFVVWVIFGTLTRSGVYPIGHLEVLAFYGLGALGTLAGMQAFRRQLINRASRNHVLGIVLLYVSYLLATAIMWQLGVSVTLTIIVHMMLGMVGFTSGALLLDRNIMPMSLAILAGLAGTLAWPDLAFELWGLSGAVGSAIVARSTFKSGEPEDDPSSQTASLR